MLLEWDGTPDCAERIIRTNVLSSPSRYRALDVVTRTFIPRFVHSDPPDLWRPLRTLDQAGWSQVALLPIHYYAAAAAEPLLWDFVVEVLSEKHARGHHEVRVSDVFRLLDRSSDSRFHGKRWSKEVSTRVARGLLAALRDLGILSGAVKKRISPLYLPSLSYPDSNHPLVFYMAQRAPHFTGAGMSRGLGRFLLRRRRFARQVGAAALSARRFLR